MNGWLLVLILMVGYLGLVAGHNPMETHTLIFRNADELTVEVELPWTVNEAARLYFQIQEGDLVSDSETAKYLKQYVLSHFYVIQNEMDLTPENMDEIPLDHGHSIKYRINYKINKASALVVENLCLMELFGEDQKNYLAVLEMDQVIAEEVLSEKNCVLQISAAEMQPLSLWLLLSTWYSCLFR